jgi:hypothetical protein
VRQNTFATTSSPSSTLTASPPGAQRAEPGVSIVALPGAGAGAAGSGVTGFPRTSPTTPLPMSEQPAIPTNQAMKPNLRRIELSIS